LMNGVEGKMEKRLKTRKARAENLNYLLLAERGVLGKEKNKREREKAVGRGKGGVGKKTFRLVFGNDLKRDRGANRKRK